MRRIDDGQQGGIAPEALSAQDGRALAPQRLQIVDQLQQPVAPAAVEPVAQLVRGAAVDTDQPAGEGVGHEAHRVRITESISSTR
jgi:hypothetical protein